MHKTLAAAAFCSALAFGAAHAAQVDPGQMFPNFTVENVSTATTALGFKVEILTDQDGTKAVGITTPDGVKFIAQPSACQQGAKECYGLSIFALFSDAVPANLLMQFNAKHIFSSAYVISVEKTTATALTRYEISDYGIPLGNVASNIGTFAGLVKIFVNFVQSSGASASLTTPPVSPPTVPAFGGAPLKEVGETSLFKLTPKQQGYINHIGH